MAVQIKNPPMQSQTPAIREFEFDQPVINIGSHPDNDVILSGDGVLPFHASILGQHGMFNIMPLTQNAEILLEGNLLRETSARLTENQRIDMGEYSLFVQQGVLPSSLHLTVFKSMPLTETSMPISTADGEEYILVNVLSLQAEVDVDQSALYEFEIINAGQIVAGFHLSIQGVPGDWVKITPRLVNLNEGQRTIVRASITPPRASSSTAGKHAINLVVSSPNYPRYRSVTQFELTIHPYYEFMVGNLSPRQQHIHWRAHKGNVSLPVTNLGNSAADFSAIAMDEENGCSFDFVMDEDFRLTRQAVVAIDAGESVILPIEVTPTRQPVIAMRSRRYHYTTSVQVAGQAIAQQTVSGSVINHPLLGWWAILLATLLTVIGIFFLIQPRINSFQVAAGKDVIELGDTTSLEWSVSPFASRVSISNVDKEVTRSMKQLTVAPKQSTTYEMVAGNWISGLLGMDRKVSRTVLVVPPTPEITVFDVDTTTVDKGVPVNIRWSVTKADQVFLTIDRVVYELPADQFSGQQTVTLEKDAIVTLEASNLSGSELRSFFVNVVPPEIIVNKFTVWVRTDGGSTTSSVAATTTASNPTVAFLQDTGSVHMAAIRPINKPKSATGPQSEFPYKFVELIEDPSSEMGYRVEFYQPDRELAKGEQVMLEWEVDGVEKIMITPFTEMLPASGSQPFFPQESMNFVMTAKSGELEEIYMLPVKVFDGIPPTAPKIDFFKAVPVKMIGSGDVQFSWSVSGEWTHIQLARGDDTGEVVVADWIYPQGFKTVEVKKSSTFLLKAWNGSLSTASPVDVTVDPALIQLGLSINNVYTDAGRFMVGQKVTVTVGFSDIPTGKPKPTGKVTVTDGFSSCSITLPAFSCDLLFNTPGTKQLTASYEGDTIYLQADSPPYAQSILVQSAAVEIVPRYFTRDTGEDITNITDPDLELDLDKGLRIMVEVRPININIPDDGKSKVNVSVCDQDVNGLMIAGTCQFVGGGTAQVATDATFGRVIGLMYADVSIYRFTATGTKLLLFDYFHDDSSIDPTSVEQPDVNIGKIKFFLNSAICTTDPDSLTGCKLGSADTADAEMTFGFRTLNPAADLQSSLPLPPASAFTFSAVGQTGAGTTTWTCTVKIVSGVYKLVCRILGLDSTYNPWTVTYTFDNAAGESYYMQNENAPDIKTGTFQLDALQNTKIVYEDMSSVTVGQIVNLTGPSGKVSIQDAAGTHLSGSITLTEKDGNNAGTFTCSSDTNCQQNSSTGEITIVDAMADSTVIFKKAGATEISAAYAGNTTTYLPSRANKAFTVLKQTGITAAWYSNYGGSAWPTGIIVNSQLNSRIVLDIPTAGFNDKSLVDRIMVVRFLGTSGISNCTIGAPSGATEGEYLVTIKWDAATSNPVADFTLSCGSTSGTLPFDISMELDFVNIGEDKTGDDLAFSASTTTIEDLTVQQNSTTTMFASIIRMPDTSPGHVNMVHTAPNTIDTFHVGEKYAVQFRISRIREFYNSWGWKYSSNSAIITDFIANDNSIVITFPPAIENAIDWSQSTCGSQNNLRIRLNRTTNVISQDYWDRSWDFWGVHWNYYYWGYTEFDLTHDPCYLVFKPDVTVNQNTTFSYTSHNGIYTTSSSYSTPGIAKQNVSMTFTPVSPYSGYVSIPQKITIDLASTTNTDTTLPKIEPAVTNFDTQFTVSTSCGSIADKKINSTSQVELTLSSNTECINGQLTVSYIQNTYFNPLTNQVYAFTFAKHTPATSLQYSNGTNWVAFPFSTTNQASTGTAYTFRVRAVDGDALGHTNIPTGIIRVKASSGTYTVRDSNNVLVTVNADGYYHITLDAEGYAVFRINFSAAATGITLQYDYTGSPIFAASTSVSETVPFNVQ